jgi:uncharacterized membrane protein YbaN (DUF454 family)
MPWLMSTSLEPRDPKRPAGALRAGWLALGLLFTALGLVGAVLPLMPTTIFLILAVGCFARSSPRLEAWLLDHPRFGPGLRAWRREKAIPRGAKVMACVGIASGFVIFVLAAHPHLAPMLAVGLVLAAIAAWIVSRPAPRSRP